MRSIPFDELHEGHVYTARFAIGEAEMDAYAAVSGDHNPLHCDDAFATDRGFDGRVVYAGLLVAQVSRVIGMELPGRDALWTGIDLQFASPLYLNQEAVIHAEVSRVSAATRSLRIQLRITRGETLLCRGRAEVSVRDDG